MVGALRCASFVGAISKMSTMLLFPEERISDCPRVSPRLLGLAGVMDSRGWVGLLGCSGDDPLQSLNLSLSL